MPDEEKKNEEEEEIKIGWDERKTIAEFILEHADDVMESWQVANALKSMTLMLKDPIKRKLLKASSIIIVEHFVDEMSRELMEDENKRKEALVTEEKEAKEKEAKKVEEKFKPKRKKAKKVKKELDSRPIRVPM